MAVGAAAAALTFHKRTGKHFPKGAEAANEPAASLKVGVGGQAHLTLIIVSEIDQVKDQLRNARMIRTDAAHERPSGSKTSASCTAHAYGITGISTAFCQASVSEGASLMLPTRYRSCCRP